MTNIEFDKLFKGKMTKEFFDKKVSEIAEERNVWKDELNRLHPFTQGTLMAKQSDGTYMDNIEVATMSFFEKINDFIYEKHAFPRFVREDETTGCLVISGTTKELVKLTPNDKKRMGYKQEVLAKRIGYKTFDEMIKEFDFELHEKYFQYFEKFVRIIVLNNAGLLDIGRRSKLISLFEYVCTRKAFNNAEKIIYINNVLNRREIKQIVGTK